MTTPEPTPPVVRPLPVRCPVCGKRSPADATPGSVVQWVCRKCHEQVRVEVPERKAA